MAMTCLAICFLWLSPIFGPEQISARDQVTRAADGVKASELPLVELAREWGHPGKTALAEIRENRPDLIVEIDATLSGQPKRRVSNAEQRQRFEQILPIYPADTDRAELSLDKLKTWEVETALSGCDQPVPEGPGCALFILPADLRDGKIRAYLFYRAGSNGVVAKPLVKKGDGFESSGRVSLLHGEPLTIKNLSALHSGAAKITEQSVPVLQLGSRTLFVHN